MSSIETLGISGIRSFDPDPEHIQSIHFHKPLTVILGKNGAGKTTIIESLLHACTGEMPPGATAASEKSSFVYDPKAAGKDEVKGQIRLQFSGVTGMEVGVVRSIMVTKAKGHTAAPKFCSMDQTIVYKSTTDGAITSNTMNAAEMNAIVPDLLGVSSAVLQHVIFCHQEASNWPLGPSRELKDRFDDIFAVTRYVQALSALRETQKQYKAILQKEERALFEYREALKKYKELTTALGRKEEEIAVCKARDKEIEPQSVKLHRALNEIKSVSQNSEQMLREQARIEGQIAFIKDELRRMNLPPTQQTLEELLFMRSEFDNQMKSVENDIEVLKAKEMAMHASRRQRGDELQRVKGELTNMEAKFEDHKKTVRELQAIVQSISKEFVIGEDDVDERALNMIEGKLQSVVHEHQSVQNKNTEQHRDELKKAQEEKMNIIRMMDSENREKDLREEQLSRVESQLKKEKEAHGGRNANTIARKIADLQTEVKELDKRVKQSEEAAKNGEIPKKLEILGAQLKEKNVRATTVRNKLASMSKHRETSDRLSHAKKYVSGIETQIEHILSKTVVPSLVSDFLCKQPKDPQGTRSVGETVEDLRLRTVNQLSQAEEGLQQAQGTLNLCEQQLNAKKSSVSQMEVDLQRLRGAAGKQFVNKLRTLPELEAALTQCENEYVKYNHEATSAEAMSSCFHGFSQTALNDHKCALCEQELSAEGIKKFVESNSEKTSPENLKKCANLRDSAKRALDELRAAEPHLRDIIRLVTSIETENNLCKKLQDEILERKGNVNTLLAQKNDICGKMDNVNKLREHFLNACRLESDAEGRKSEILALERNLASIISAEGGSVSTDDSFETLNTTHETLLNEIHALNTEVTDLQSRMVQGNEENALRQQLMEKRMSVSEAEGHLEAAKKFEASIERFSEEKSVVLKRMSEIKSRRATLQEKVNSSDTAISKLEKQHATNDRQASDSIQLAQNNLSTFSRHSEIVKRNLLTSDRVSNSKLVAVRDSIKGVTDACTQIDQEITTIRKTVETNQKLLDDRHRNLKKLEEHIHGMEKTRDLALLQQKLDDSRHAVGGMLRTDNVKAVEVMLGGSGTFTDPEAFTRAIEAKIKELTKEQGRIIGCIETSVKDVSEIKRALAADIYHDIEDSYKAKFVSVTTHELTVGDLDTYYVALDRAVQSYHRDKIAEINKHISELWRQTYRGSDIDTIEIKAEDDTAGTASRRSYKYRVVMKRGHSELDMRGRCSAGQKVLASVIIRIALSDAFSCECGILALDEPTTNLDEDNARSLAESLHDVIRARHEAKNFQLIVITHDEHFVKHLGARSADSFYFVHKDRQGAFSVIDTKKFSEF